MRCPRCQTENRDGRRFCGECGLAFASPCPSCGFVNEPGGKFCGGCGTALPPSAAPQARFISPGAYTPKHLAERILTSKAALEGERKQVTVLFADLKGSMELLADRDPEEARKLLDPVLEHMMEAVHRYEGTVNQVMGDGIMALFGAPLAHEDHAVRACYAALLMQQAVKRYAEEVRRSQGANVQIRVGLNSGEVVVRTIGSDLHMDYTAVGSTTHLAARMEQLADPGSILLSADTLRLAEGYVDVKPLGRIPVKGLAEPIEVFEITGAGAARRRLEAAAIIRGLTQFVGRGAQFDRLQAALERVVQGHGQVVAVVGELGVGKSRLLYEFIHSHQTRGSLILESSSVSYGRATSYLPVIGLLRNYFKIQEGRDDAREVRDKVIGRVFGLDRSLEPLLPPLLALLDVTVDDAPWHALDPWHRRERTLDALKQLFLQESRVQPLLLIIEDLHWSDSETQAFLDTLIDSLSHVAVLLLVSYRPEYRDSWGSKTYYSRIGIDPLPPEGAEELLDALLGHNSALASLKQLLVERTEGNPLFLEESVRALVETGVFSGERGAYRLGKPAEHFRVPATVQAMLAARVDQLPVEEKHLLQCAAVIGKDVPYALLHAIAGVSEDELRRGLTHLQSAEFLYETTVLPRVEYTFKHALTQMVTYEALLTPQRRVLHLAAGRALETLYAERTDEIVELLAHHFGRSDDDTKAVDYALLAAEKAQRRWANAEAIAHFEAALNRLRTMPTSEANCLRQIDGVIKQAEVKFALGRHADHIEALESISGLVEQATDPSRRAAWYCWTGFFSSLTGGQLERSIAYCRQAAAIAEAASLEDLRAVAESCLLQVYTVAGDLRSAMEVGERALTVFTARGSIWWTCRTLWHLGTAANHSGQWQRSLAYCRRALEYALEVNDLRLRVVGWYRLGSAHAYRGDHDEGLRCFEQALALSPNPFDAAMIKALRGRGLVMMGQIAAGVADLEEAVAWFDRSQLRFTRSLFALRLAEAYLRQGSPRRARAVLEEVLATTRKLGYRHLEGVAERLFAESLATEDPTATAAHVELAIGILEKVGAENELAKALVIQGELVRRYDLPKAREHLERALALFEALGTVDEPSRVRGILASL